MCVSCDNHMTLTFRIYLILLWVVLFWFTAIATVDEQLTHLVSYLTEGGREGKWGSFSHCAVKWVLTARFLTTIESVLWSRGHRSTDNIQFPSPIPPHMWSQYTYLISLASRAGRKSAVHTNSINDYCMGIVLINRVYPTGGYVWISEHSFAQWTYESLVLGSLCQHNDLLNRYRTNTSHSVYMYVYILQWNIGTHGTQRVSWIRCLAIVS